MKKYIYFRVSIACLVVFAGLGSVAQASPRTHGEKTNEQTVLTDIHYTKGGPVHTHLGVTGKKSPLVVRPMQMTAERYHYVGPDVYTWRFTINMTVQAIGETVYLADSTSAGFAPGNNLVRFMENDAIVHGGVTVGTYADISVSPSGNFVLLDGEVEHVTVIVEYTEEYMSPDFAYQAVLKNLRYNTDDSDSYKIKYLDEDFQTEEIYID